MQQMIEIPLEGYLLVPVQKICQYPLQLKELIKLTPPNHPDYEPLISALEAMKLTACLINERKRKMESLEKLAMWQTTIAGWQVWTSAVLKPTLGPKANYCYLLVTVINFMVYSIFVQTK